MMPMKFRFNVKMLCAVWLCVALLPGAVSQEEPPTAGAAQSAPVLSTPVSTDASTAQLTSTPSLPLDQPTTMSLNCTANANATECNNLGVGPGAGYGHQLLGIMIDNKAMLMRSFYVLLGVTLIVVVYFGVRTIRWRSRNNRIKRYGLLSQNDDRLEMQPLDQDEDDEDDMTVFDINRK